tara:strand:- start:86 stop:490 length:405 start_codon:yes stop_codon:yes gene_type:complete
MNNQPAFKELTNTYDIEDMQEIVNHGCQSGVCFKHIYYADTIEFFTKYPDEITSYIVDNIGIDWMKQTFARNTGNLDMYMNDISWAFIELVCGQIVDEFESTTCEELSDDPLTNLNALKELTFRSLNDNRYAQV